MFCFNSSRPLITGSGRDGPKSEYELASEFYQILNHKAADGSAYITVSPKARVNAVRSSLHACILHLKRHLARTGLLWTAKEACTPPGVMCMVPFQSKQTHCCFAEFCLCPMQVDVTVTAKADQPWLWGVQSAVEAIFITQAKDDILSYLEYSVRLFKELHAMQQASLSHLRIPGDLKLAGLAMWVCMRIYRLFLPNTVP